jgi:hypothetical protein
MSNRALNVVISTFLFVLGFASAGFAQPPSGTAPPTFELSAGYQFLHVPDQNFPFGLAVDGARHFGLLGVAGEIGWSRDSDDAFGFDVSTNLSTSPQDRAGPGSGRDVCGRMRRCSSAQPWRTPASTLPTTIPATLTRHS